jgi:uncharacterized protein YjlB
MDTETKLPETYLFQDDGMIPNSNYPLIIYRNAFPERGEKGAAWLEKHFAENKWTNSWRNGVLSYHHYHSISHEVLGIYEGNAVLQLGGERGKHVQVQAGDILVIPAGVGHKNISSSGDLAIVGAYPNGSDYDILSGKPGERPAADVRIAAIPMPEYDPFKGKDGGLLLLWA